ncbi:MAG: class I SAM-dependent methyltransferase [Candidatus Omnitrophica bacterium]|jgi:ubiquinone/menaquinone biosynthesis C-methylase UbiE|nr:class I SAM-dependent methyltransferase [Candidatus Omnitrophota bacterium]
MSGVFDKHYRKYDAWYDQHKFAFLSELEAVKKVLPRTGRGLEIGVGTGRFAASLGITMGIDPARQMLKIARKRGVNTRLGSGEELLFGDKTFDYVLIIITLCFVKNPKKVIAETSRILKKNGRIIIGIIDKESFLGKFYRKKKSAFYKGAKFFSVQEVTDLLKAGGFGRFSYYQTISIFPDIMKSVEQPKKGFSRGGFVVIAGRRTK